LEQDGFQFSLKKRDSINQTQYCGGFGKISKLGASNNDLNSRVSEHQTLGGLTELAVTLGAESRVQER